MRTRSIRGLPLLLLFLPSFRFSVACSEGRERIGASTGPTALPDVVGGYQAVHLIVERDGDFTELVGEPDTRLDLRLNADGTAHGQLKIGTDPELRTKTTLAGSWRFAVPGTVTFDFAEGTFLSETAFRVVSTDRLSGEWLGEGVRVRVVLERVEQAAAGASSHFFSTLRSVRGQRSPPSGEWVARPPV